MTDSAAARRSSRRRPPLAAAIALVCLLGQALALVHLLVERHQLCRTHGEVDHAGDSAHARPVNVGAEVAAGAPALEAATSTDHDGGGDEHCRVLGERRDLPAAAEAWRQPLPEDAPPAATAAPAPPARAAALYRLAPKNSPPATA